MLVNHYLRRAAAGRPDAVAVIDGRRSVSYTELAELAVRFANALIDAGVTAGERVVVALDNSAEFIACYFGAMEAGAIAVPLSPGSRSDRLVAACADCQPVVCVADSAAAALIATDAPASLRLLLVAGSVPEPLAGVMRGKPLNEALAEASSTRPEVRRIDADLAAIIYTSGSTGEPRGVMLSHLNICANTASIVEYLRLTASDRMLVVLPFFYVYGLSLLHTHVSVGGSLVLVNSLAFPNVAVKAMATHAVTGFAGVPSTFALMLERSNLAGMSLPALRYVTQAGGAMPPARIRGWLRAMPSVPLFVMYGATEASARLAYLDPAELPERIGSVGRAIPNVELRVLREDGSPADVGEVGEIVARGSNISSGYWQQPERTAERFRPEGFRTGDLGSYDATGCLTIVGRKGDMLKIGGHRVSAREIEDAIAECADVVECAVIGTEHKILGDAPVAFVSLREGLTTDGVIAFSRERLSEAKVPVAVIACAALPKNAAGKIDKGQLREMLASMTAATAVEAAPGVRR
jgi:long-chain acyl-CoA synthetase